MSQEAAPIWEAYIEESKKHPEGGKEFNDAFEKRLGKIKKQSIEEKKQGSLSYRQTMAWAGIQTQQELDEKCREAVEGYHSGEFFLERVGRYREVDLPLTLAILNLRKQWIKEYDIKTAPEFMLLDMALASYFHFLRLNEQINNVMASIEWEMFALDVPRFNTSYYRGLSGKHKDKAIAEDLAYHLQEILQPILDQFNRMFIRNLKALRDLRRGSILLNIGNVGQMNVGNKQINVEK